MLNKLTAAIQKTSPGLRQIIGNTAWLSGDRFLRMFVGLLIGVWVARYLGPDQFGLFNYAIAFVALLEPLVRLGLDRIVVRDIVRDPTCKDETLGTAFLLKLVGGIVTLLLAVGIILLLRPHDTLTGWLVGIVAAGMIFGAFDTIDLWFQSQVEARYTVVAKNAAYLLVNLAKIALIQMQAPLIAFAWAMFAEYALGAVGLIISYQKKGHLLKAWRGSAVRAKNLLKDSLPLIFSSIVVLIYMRIDQVMLGQMKDAETVGVYSAAVKISELWYFVPISIVNSVFPSIIKAKEVSEQLYSERTQKLFNIMAIVSYAVAIVVTLFSTQLVTLLFGHEYASAGPILSVHIWAGLFVGLGVASNPWVIAEGLTKFWAATSAIGALVNIVLNYYLIGTYGGIGAAVATIIAQMISAYGANAFHPKAKKLFIHQTQAILLIDFLKFGQFFQQRSKN